MTIEERNCDYCNGDYIKQRLKDGFNDYIPVKIVDEIRACERLKAIQEMNKRIDDLIEDIYDNDLGWGYSKKQIKSLKEEGGKE